MSKRVTERRPLRFNAEAWLHIGICNRSNVCCTSESATEAMCAVHRNLRRKHCNVCCTSEFATEAMCAVHQNLRQKQCVLYIGICDGSNTMCAAHQNLRRKQCVLYIGICNGSNVCCTSEFATEAMCAVHRNLPCFPFLASRLGSPTNGKSLTTSAFERRQRDEWSS